MMRRKKRRLKVDRTERVRPPPEAAQHHRVWPMQLLLHLGPPDGIDADEFEAALQIVETWHILTGLLDMRTEALSPARMIAQQFGGAYMSDRDAERCNVWFDWSSRLPAGLPPRLVAWVEDQQPIGSVEVLRRACRLWDKVRSDRAKPPVAALDTQPRHMLTMPARNYVETEIAARPVNRPVQPLSDYPAPPYRPALSSPAGAQMRDVRWHKTRRPG